MEAKTRNWGRFSLSVDLMEKHPRIIATGMKSMIIESIVYNGERDTFDLVAEAPFFGPITNGGLPEDHILFFRKEEVPGGTGIFVGFEKL